MNHGVSRFNKVPFPLISVFSSFYFQVVYTVCNLEILEQVLNGDLEKPAESLWVSGGQGLVSWGVGRNVMSLFAQIYAEIRDVPSNMSCNLLLGLAINSEFL